MSRSLLAAKSKLQRSEKPSFSGDAISDFQQQNIVNDKERDMQVEHVNKRLHSHKYYQVCRQEPGGAVQRMVFQVICKHPDRRAYVQRVCFLGRDVSQLSIQFHVNFALCFLAFVVQIHTSKNQTSNFAFKSTNQLWIRSIRIGMDASLSTCVQQWTNQ